MSRRHAPLLVSCVALALSLAPRASAQFHDVGNDIREHDAPDKFSFELHGYLRTRGEVLSNLDLDRGLTPSGEALFAVPLDDPSAQNLTQADMRLRTDLSVYAPGGSVAVHVRLDLIDNLTLGSTPDDIPAATVGQRALDSALHLRRAWGEVLTPFGLLTIGRQSNSWGLGLLANAGDCPDCDGGDAADRIAFTTPIAGHIWSLAFDLSSTGPLGGRITGTRAVDLTPTDDVQTVTLAVLQWLGEASRRRRHVAGRTSVEYGAYLSYRWQQGDTPASYLPTSTPIPLTAAQIVPRGLNALATDVWLRVEQRNFRVEFEGALLYSSIESTSLIPGVLLRDSVTGTQFGGALETDFLPRDGAFTLGMDLGFASGDSAPGFGAFPRALQASPLPGDLDGPQATLPYDTTVDNFRFHPDYRIDRILFREIIGRVTDAYYFRPHLRWRWFDQPFGTLAFTASGVASFAVYASSTPGNRSPLGVEFDPALTYESGDGFTAALEYGVLFPLSGFANPNVGLTATPAQLLRLRLQLAY
jgi:uncharacterized protein (TIGR04551 family)